MTKKLIKKGISLFLGIALLAAGSSAAFANTDDEIQYSVIFNGEKLIFDQNPVNVNDRVLVPMRGIFEAYGAEVDWDSETETVIAVSGDKEIRLTIDSNFSYINGKKYRLDTPAIIVGGRTMVPVRFVSEALEAYVDWNQDTYSVIIEAQLNTQPTIPAPEEEETIFTEMDDVVYDEGFFSTQDGIKGSCYLTCLGMISSNLNEDEIRASDVYKLNGNSVEQHDWYGLLEKLNITRTDYFNLKGESAESKVKTIVNLLKDNPEGVIVRFINSTGYSHYIVFKGFENGRLIGNDPVGQAYTSLDKTWVGYSMFNGYDDAIEGMVLVEAYDIGRGSVRWDLIKNTDKTNELQNDIYSE